MKTPLEIIIEKLEGVDKVTLGEWTHHDDDTCRCPIGYIIPEVELICWSGDSYESRAAVELGVTEDWVGDFVSRIDATVTKWSKWFSFPVMPPARTDEEKTADAVFKYIIDNFDLVKNPWGFKFTRKKDGTAKADSQGLSA